MIKQTINFIRYSRSLRYQWCKFCFYIAQPTSVVAIAIIIGTTMFLHYKIIDDNVADCLYVISIPFWMSQRKYEDKLKQVKNNALMVILLRKILEEFRK